VKDPKNKDLGQSDTGASDAGKDTTPEFILNPKFKNVEEQAKGYGEAEKLATNASKRAAEAEAEVERMKQEKINKEAGDKLINFQGQQDNQPVDMNKFFQDPVGTIREEATKIATKEIQKVVAPILFEQRKGAVRAEIKELAKDNPDLQEIYPLALKKLEQNPELQKVPNALTIAVGMVRSDQHQKKIAEQGAVKQDRDDKGKLSGGQIVKQSEIMGEGEAGDTSSGQDKTIEEKIADDFVKSGLGKNPALF